MNSEDLPLGVRRAMLRPTTLQQPVARTHQMPIPEPETGLERVGWVNSTIAAPEAGGALIAKDENRQGWIDRWLPCIPPTRTAQQKGVYVRNKKPAFYTKKSVKQAATTFRSILAPILPAEPLKGPLSFAVTFVYPWPKATPKYRKIPEGEPISTRPDCSNLVKMLEDVMTEMGFWEDDSQIYSLAVRKFRGNEPGMSIRIGP